MAEVVGETRLLGSEDWAETALYGDRAAFEDALHRMGLTDEVVAEALVVRDDAYASATAPINLGNARFYGIDGPFNATQERRERNRRWARQSLLDWLSGREWVTEESTMQTVDIPIFVLDSPAVDGCSTTLTRSRVSEEGACWTLGLAGSGFSRSSTIATTVTSTVSSRGGHAKLIFQPLVVEVALVSLREKGQVRSRGLQVVPITSSKDLPPPGAMDFSRPMDVRSASPVDFRLSGDTSEDMSEYSFEYESSSGLTTKVGVTAFGATADLAVSRRLQRSLALTAELVAGRDYAMRQLADIDGIRWEASPL